MPSRPSPGSYPEPVQVPSRVRGGPVQIRHVLCFTVFGTHPGPEVGAIPARPGPILLPSVPSRIGPGRAETDFLATSDTNCGRASIPSKVSRDMGYRSDSIAVSRDTGPLSSCQRRAHDHIGPGYSPTISMHGEGGSWGFT